MKKVLNVLLAVCAVTCLSIAFTSCAHEHVFSESWSTDETQHWHICTSDGCEEKSELGEHVFDNACDTTCNECGYTRSTEHSYDTTTWKSDETGHWHECTVCGGKTDFAAHTESAIKSDDSKHWHDCTVCGYVIDKNDHEYSESWSTDETQHWHICTGDGCEEKSELGEHVFDNACDTTCNECGYTRTIEHSYDTTTWKSDETGHWHECTVCGDKTDFAEHIKSTKISYNDSTHWYGCTECEYKLDECEHEFLDENYNQEKDNLKCTYCNQSKNRTKTYFYFEVKSYENLNKYYTGSPVEFAESEYFIQGAGANDAGLTVTWKYKIGSQTKEYDGLPTAIGTYKVQAYVHGNAKYEPCRSEGWKTLYINAAHVSLEKPLYTCMSDKNSELSFTLGHDDCSAIAPGESITIKTTLSYDYYYDTTYAYAATLKVKTVDSSTKNQYEEFVELQKTGDYANYVLDTNFGKLEFKKHTYNEYGVCSGANNESDTVCYEKNWTKGVIEFGADATTTITHEDRSVGAGEYSCLYLSITSSKIDGEYHKEYAKIIVGNLVGVEYSFYEVISSWGGTSYRLIDTETEFDNGIFKLFDENNKRQYRGILISFKNTTDEAISLEASITLEFYIELSVGETTEIDQKGPVYLSATLTNDGDADKYFEFNCTCDEVVCEIVDFDGKTIDLSTTAIAAGETKVILIKLTYDGWIEFNVTLNEKTEAA